MSQSDISCTYHGKIDEVEVIDLTVSFISVFARDRCPTIPVLLSLLTRERRPTPDEVEQIEHFRNEDGTMTYRIYVLRAHCPVMLLPRMTVCPICKEEH